MPPRVAPTLSRSNRKLALAQARAALEETLLASGYTDLCVLQGRLCGIRQFNYTTALVVGLDPTGYHLRYCYEHRSDAQAAIEVWDGRGHPPGPWIKCKGGGVDLLNPDFCRC